MGLFAKIFGSNDRVIAKLRPIVARVNAHEAKVSALSDEALRAKTEEFRARIGKGASLDQVLPEAFAVVREAAKRVIGERH